MKGFTLVELLIGIMVIFVLVIVAIPPIQDHLWLHDREHPERLERYEAIHDRQGVKDSDCARQKRLLKQEC